MRTYLAAVVALGLSWNAAAVGHAGEHYVTPLPGALGRFCGIGYGPGYHARYPNRPVREQRVHPFAAPAYHSQLVHGPVVGLQDARSASQAVGPQVRMVDPQPPQEALRQPDAAASNAARAQTIQQPPREQPSSDRASFLKRLPNMRGAARVSDLPTPPSPPKKASVARSSVLEIDPR